MKTYLLKYGLITGGIAYQIVKAASKIDAILMIAGDSLFGRVYSIKYLR